MFCSDRASSGQRHAQFISNGGSSGQESFAIGLLVTE